MKNGEVPSPGSAKSTKPKSYMSRFSGIQNKPRASIMKPNATKDIERMQRYKPMFDISEDAKGN